MSVVRRDLGEFTAGFDDDLIICRCEEVTKGEIRRAVREGMFNIHEVRRFLRCGMGLCQGQTCARLVKGIIARELGVSQGELEDAVSRAPMRPTEMRVFAVERGVGNA
ncbi:MAG: (2Fe-2S)-binding protein [Oscillospiraceae bacterium]|nr:(2Fe-2S)-binding protein [Oscillospiraceae bacterium]